MVGNLTGTSGATGGAFAIAEGVLTVEVTGGSEAGVPAEARWWPSFGEDFVSVSFGTTSPEERPIGRSIRYLPESGRLKLEGGVEVGEVDTLRVSQRDPVRQGSLALLSALKRRGIEVQGGLRIAWGAGEPVGPGTCTSGAGGPDSDRSGDFLPECSDAIRITGVTSPPLSEVVRAILEPSQNWMTEQLVRTLGMERGREGSWQEGFDVQRRFLTQDVGVDTLDVTFRDGSGLSAYNLVTPRAMVRILEYMRDSSNSGIYRHALASPGEDGTLRRRLPGLESRVFAKTGTITHVNSLSGYVFTDSGRELIFSILTNGSGISSGLVRAGIDRIAEVAARH
jgi:D-alanyl-D-alanine carboxypeptidase/D-alanyl-D-alanine-endopeptidase (penicillin-binding protein 4)